jgi:hypothetical protein
MRFSFEIGDTEKHSVEFEFNQLFGRTRIVLDGREIKRTRRLFSEPLRQDHEFSVDEKGALVVRIEKERQIIFASKYRIFLNRRLMSVKQGR